MSDIKWQKSSLSTNGVECIEIATLSGPDSVALRESDDADMVLAAGRAGLRALLRSIKADDFARLG